MLCGTNLFISLDYYNYYFLTDLHKPLYLKYGNFSFFDKSLFNLFI